MTAAATFNNGRSQTNLNFLQLGGEFPFINFLKTAVRWTYVDNSSVPLPTELDSDGYLTSASVVTNHGGIKTDFYIPSATDQPQPLVATWTGKGVISIPGAVASAGFSSADLDSTATGIGRYEFTYASKHIDFRIVGVGSPYITNVKIFSKAEESRLNAGEIFGVKFKSRLAEANFGVIRFLNWQRGNTTNVTNWASGRAESYVYYEGYEFRANLYAGVTTNSSNAYSVATLPGTLIHSSDGTTWTTGQSPKDKDTVTIQFNAAATQSGTCSLNLGGAGAINILDSYSNALSPGGNSYPLANITATLVYDATLNAWIKWGGDTALRFAGIDNGVPASVCLRLAAELGAHAYFVTPHLSIDPATDYMTTLAAYCRDNAPAWMVPRFEGPNELWNTFGGFFQTIYAQNKAIAYGWGSNNQNAWYGKIMSVLGQAVSTVYSADRTRYHVIAGVQTGSYTNTSQNDDRLTSNTYINQVPAAQSPYTKSAAANWVTHICVAQYWNPALQNTGTETSMIAAYAASPSSALAYTYADSSIFGSPSLTVYVFDTVFGNWKSWAQGLGVNKMCGYEGCYSPDYINDVNTDTLRYASKPSPNLGAALTHVYTSFTKMSDATFTAEFPSNFILGDFTEPGSNAGGTTSYVWAIFMGDIYQATTPQWDAICRWNAAKRAPSLRLRIHG